MVVGIGGFRDIGDPNDPRRRRGPTPAPRIIPGLPGEQLSDPRQYTSNLARLIAGDIDEGAVRDKRIRNRGERLPLISADELLSERTEYPSSPAIYGSFMAGLPKEADTRDLRAASSDGDPSFATKADEFTRDIAAYGTLQVPERQTSGQYVRRPGERGTDAERRREGLVLRTIDPQAIALTREGDLDSPYTSGQTEEVSIGRLAKELKKEFKTPVIGQTALVTNRLAGTDRLRFRSLNEIENVSPEMAASMVEAFGKEADDPGTFVGIYEVSPAVGDRPQREKGVFSSVASGRKYVPVYQVLDKDGDPTFTNQEVPAGIYGTKQRAEPLYRLGAPFAFDSSAIKEELGPQIGSQNVRSTPGGRGGVVRKEKVARYAQSSGQQLFAEKSIDENGQVLLSNPVSGNQIDGSRPLYFERDGRVDALIPRLNKEGQPTGSYISTSKYTVRSDRGPGAVSSDVGAAIGAGKPETFINNRNRILGGRLGEANATSTHQLITDLAAMASTTEPVTRNAYRDVIAPMIIQGKISIDDVAPGNTYARQLIQQAVQEVSNQGATGEVIPGGSSYAGTGEAYDVDTDVFTDADDFRDEATFDEAYRRDPREKGYSYINAPELEGVADPGRYQRVTEMIRQRLQGGLDDSEAILGRRGTGPMQEGSVTAGSNADQARYLAEIVLQNAGDDPGSSARPDGQRLILRRDLGGLLGGEVKGEMGGRIGRGITGETADYAKQLRNFYQNRGVMSGTEADMERVAAGESPMSYSEMARGIGSNDPEVDDRAMAALALAARNRQQSTNQFAASQQPIVSSERSEKATRTQESGEFLNAPRKEDAFLMAQRRKFGL